MLTFLTILAAAVYGSGAGYLWHKGLLRALVWPLALGVALARYVERDAKILEGELEAMRREGGND